MLQHCEINTLRIWDQLIQSEDEAHVSKQVVAHFMHLCDLINPSTGALLQKAIDYIASNYSLRLRLEDVAKHLFISPVWLSRLFRTKMDMTFLQYITQLKMEDAKVMLKHNDISIQQIASRLGYEDAVYFTKFFKRHVGISPTEYRRS